MLKPNFDTHFASVPCAISPEIISEYYQEISKSQTSDKPVALCGKATQHSRDNRKTKKQSNQLSLHHQDVCKTRMDTR